MDDGGGVFGWRENVLVRTEEKHGKAAIREIMAGGKIGGKVAEYDWTGGWTMAKFYEVAGKPYVLFLKAGSGVVHVNRVEPDGRIGSRVQDYDWRTGWTGSTFYSVAGQPYVLFVTAWTGQR